MGRDLDVLVAGVDVERAASAARRVLEHEDLTVGIPPRIWGTRLVAGPIGSEPDLLEIHRVAAITWRNVVLTDGPQPTASLGPFQVDPWVSFAKRVLMPLLAGSIGTLRAQPQRFKLQPSERGPARRALRPCWALSQRAVCWRR